MRKDEKPSCFGGYGAGIESEWCEYADICEMGLDCFDEEDESEDEKEISEKEVSVSGSAKATVLTCGKSSEVNPPLDSVQSSRGSREPAQNPKPKTEE